MKGSKMLKLRLKLKIEGDDKVYSHQLAVKLHGWLMEQLPGEVADLLHRQSVNPYSQSVRFEEDHFLWEINALTEEMSELFREILVQADEIELDSLPEHDIRVIARSEESIGQEDFMEVFYQDRPTDRYRIKINSPMAFRQQGRYVMLPDLRLLVQSLLMKYNFITEGEAEADEELLNELVNAIHISSYNLRSHYFAVHRQKIPAFLGQITLSLRGPDSLLNFMQVLLEFGEYSGLGIKTSMGMGSMIILDKRKRRQS